MIINGQTFYEDAKEPMSPEGMAANDNGRVIRSLVMRTPGTATTEANRYRGMKALLGFQTLNRETVSGVGRIWINRSTPGDGVNTGGGLPAYYPAQVDLDLNPNGTPFLRCTNISSVKMVGAPTGIATDTTPGYGAARFTCEFNTTPYFYLPDASVIALAAPGIPSPLAPGFPGGAVGRPDEGSILQVKGWLQSRFISRHFKPGSRTITLPNGFMKNVRLTTLGATNTGVNQGLAIKEALSNLKYVWHQVPLVGVIGGVYYTGIPFAGIGLCLGSVNCQTFDGFPQGTLLLTDVEIKQYWSALGQILADVLYTMGYLPHRDVVPPTEGGGFNYNGWNSILQIDNSGTPPIKKLRYDVFTSDGLSIGGPGSTSLNAAFPQADYSALFRPDQL